jgi:hypothetical protein
MIGIRLGAFLLLATLATAWQTSVSQSANSNIPDPKLRGIDYKACPGNDRPLLQTKIERADRVYSSWKNRRVPVATLNAGDEVNGLAARKCNPRTRQSGAQAT